MTAAGRPPPARHPRAWPLHGGRDARRASPFPDSSPPPGERIKERGGRSAQAESKEEGGRTQRLEVAPAAPLTLPSPPKGRGRQERAARGNDKGGAPGCCLSPPRVAVASRQGRASRIPFSRFLSPAGGEDQGEGGMRKGAVLGPGEGPLSLIRKPAAPRPYHSRGRSLHTPLTCAFGASSPPKGRGKEERASRARTAEAQASRAGMTKEAHAPPFPDSSPPAGERNKKGTRSGEAAGRALAARPIDARRTKGKRAPAGSIGAKRAAPARPGRLGRKDYPRLT